MFTHVLYHLTFSSPTVCTLVLFISSYDFMLSCLKTLIFTGNSSSPQTEGKVATFEFKWKPQEFQSIVNEKEKLQEMQESIEHENGDFLSL